MRPSCLPPKYRGESISFHSIALFLPCHLYNYAGHSVQRAFAVVRTRIVQKTRFWHSCSGPLLPFFDVIFIGAEFEVNAISHRVLLSLVTPEAKLGLGTVKLIKMQP